MSIELPDSTLINGLTVTLMDCGPLVVARWQSERLGREAAAAIDRTDIEAWIEASCLESQVAMVMAVREAVVS